MKTFPTLLCICLFFPFILNATHNLAGEIIYQQTGQFSVEAHVRTYTKESSRAADRDSLELCWGDGNCHWVYRSNGFDINGDGFPDGEILGNGIKLNIYSSEHTYAAFGDYNLSMTDPNRNAGIFNVNYPSSDMIPLYLETELKLSANTSNQSPVPTMHPIDQGKVGIPFFHNPNAYDPDGDSLVYELISPLQALGINVPNYQFPNEVGSGLDNNISLDPQTGFLLWNNPQVAGEYNVAILIKEYRNEILIGQIVRDMQITIKPGSNLQLPDFDDPVTQLNVPFNETLKLDFQVNSSQPVRLFAYGEPFLTDPAATFQTDTAYAMNGNAMGTLSWELSALAARELPYRVIIKAETIDKVISIHLLNITIDGLVNVSSNLISNTQLQVFPNPANQNIRLYLQQYKLEKDGKIHLFNHEGKLLAEQKIRKGESKWDLSLDQLTKGVYYLRLISGGLVFEEKVVKYE